MLMLLAALPQADADRSRTRRAQPRLPAGDGLAEDACCRGSIRRSGCRSTRCSPSRSRWSTSALILGPTHAGAAGGSPARLDAQPRPRRAGSRPRRARSLQLGLVLAALALWRGLERGGRARRPRLGRGRRPGPARPGAARARRAGGGARHRCPRRSAARRSRCGRSRGSGLSPTCCRPSPACGVWAGALPALGAPLGATLALGGLSVAAALALVLGCLEAEARSGRRPGAAALWLLYLPLLIPQVAFLFGLQTLGVAARVDGGLLAVAAAHLVFVLPYVYLALADPWRRARPALRRGRRLARRGAGAGLRRGARCRCCSRRS